MAERFIFMDCKFNENFAIGEDVCLWIDIAYKYEFGAIKEPLTNVRISNSSAFQNREKLCIGFNNIISHIFKNPKYMAFEYEVGVLLRDFSHILQSPYIRSEPKYQAYTLSITQKAMNYFRTYGARATISKIIQKIRQKNNMTEV